MTRSVHQNRQRVLSFVALVLAMTTPSLAQEQKPSMPAPQSTNTTVTSPSDRTGYQVKGQFVIGGSGGWDFISIDGKARRLYVSHGDQVEVLDVDSGKLVGHVVATAGVHGIAIASEFQRGFTSNGHDKSATIFDTKSLAAIERVQLQSNPDFILYDPFSKRVFLMAARMTVLDARTGVVTGTLDLGGNPEAAVSDEKGTVYVNLADKNAVAVVDPTALAVTKTFPIDHCTSPHSLLYDAVSQRLFVGCSDGFAVLNAVTGKVVGRTLMCSGVDSGGYDLDTKLIFESCAEGVISIIRQVTPDYYQLIETVPTQLWARTMAFDPRTKNIYLPTAEVETVRNTNPNYPALFQTEIKPGSFTVLVVGKE